MLNIIRGVACRRAILIRQALAAPYSTTVGTKSPETWGDLSNELRKEDQRQPPRPEFSSKKGARRDNAQWKAFVPNRPMRPHELSYKSRVVSPPVYRKRAAVGPPPSVARYTDVFHQLGIDPLSQAQNPPLLAAYMSEMGKIYSRNITGLTSKSQRRIGKAIRRAKMMGIIPILSKPKSLYPPPFRRT